MVIAKNIRNLTLSINLSEWYIHNINTENQFVILNAVKNLLKATSRLHAWRRRSFARATHDIFTPPCHCE